MLTRLEVQGFKNLLDVTIDFGPFTCIAGANGMGKSNIFDAIEFLSYLATDSLTRAAQKVRGTSDAVGSDPRDLFWDGYRQNEHRIRIAAEMIVPNEVEDELGERARPEATFLRYEVTLGYGPTRGEHGGGRLHLLREDLRQVEDPKTRLRFAAGDPFLDSLILSSGRDPVYLSTDRRGAQAAFINSHEGGHTVEKSRSPGRAARTVLSTTITAENPTILAARHEMQRWRRLALEPSALRSPDDETGPERMSPRGRHLPSTLYRVAHAPDWSGDPERVYARVAGRLSDLTGLAVEALDVEFDDVRQTFTLFLQERGGLRLPARALSEGTLRFLALCVLLEDSEFNGLVCMEEPENGIHPANLPAMVQLVRDLVVDPTESPGTANPFRQVIINTHSPGVVQLCDPSDLLLAQLRPRSSAGRGIVRSLAVLPYRSSWRAQPGQPTFSEADVVAYLTNPPATQLHIPPGLSA
ncbi:AAA family ATPase [Micromonospora echinospora]|uniref:ATPase n=1 Tax=Micromonospora echinospora TaxID=1877 RepID=A0ABR6MJ29_MICEC|nr:AAA family ATPase [Micromonospora echinospora]MBB5115390.1 putative ATPase [Micromonospora echinospora]